jgi:hypothetical protein
VLEKHWPEVLSLGVLHGVRRRRDIYAKAVEYGDEVGRGGVNEHDADHCVAAVFAGEYLHVEAGDRVAH